jgi:hypothetical protein
MASDPIEQACGQLMAAGLIPPVSGLQVEGQGVVVLLVRAEPDEALVARVAEALGPLPYELRFVSATYGLLAGPADAD